jgi:hypothetical protein
MTITEIAELTASVMNSALALKSFEMLYVLAIGGPFCSPAEKGARLHNRSSSYEIRKI